MSIELPDNDIREVTSMLESIMKTRNNVQLSDTPKSRTMYRIPLRIDA